jgi:hypothetical protein
MIGSKALVAEGSMDQTGNRNMILTNLTKATRSTMSMNGRAVFEKSLAGLYLRCQNASKTEKE